jgi:ABC-type phosphate transport system substrate-binding protein
METPVMNILIKLIMLSVIIPMSVFAAETVIVNGKSMAGGLSEDQAREFFLGKRTVWEDGSKVVVVVLKEGPSHEGLMRLLGKSPSQFSTGWKKIVFTGKGSMPEQVDSEAELIEFVARTPGAIGFIDAGKVKDGVKAVPLR